MTEREEAVDLLIVDDDPAIAVMAQTGLGQYGYSVRALHSGHEVLDAVEQDPPDAILLDVVMPGVSGFTVCRQLADSPSTRRIPVIIITGLDDSASIEMAYEAGATAFVTKPINWPILRHQLQFVLRASRDKARLAESEERYALAASGASDGLWDWNLVDRTLYLSPRWLEQLVLRQRDIGNDMEGWFQRIHPDDLLGFRNELNAHLSGGSASFEIEYRIRDGRDRYRWMLCRALAVRDVSGQALRIAGSQTDITERKLAEEQLFHDALHDSLTGLANRRLLLERITHAMRLAQRHQAHHFVVAVMDLDRFKTINDSLGHFAGDSLLQRVSERVARHMRTSDTLARIGGDEFAILFFDTGDLEDLDRVIQRILLEISQPFLLQGQEVVTTASIGVAVSSPAYVKAEEMLRDADIAMYQAKARGKNRYRLFDSTMHTLISESLQMENDLRQAIRRQELRLHYQPIRDLASDRIAGFEALLRWQHPRQGLLRPDAFLDIAEEADLLVTIGQWTLEQATRQLACWQQQLPEASDAYIAVNLSNREFTHPGLVDNLTSALSTSGIVPQHLRLEITENMLIDHSDRFAHVLEQLRALGISLAIDDFGTGYSSFGYLERLTFDVLKIDRAFVQAIDHNATRREIVTMADNLGLTVIAEGGETAAEIDCLREIGCRYHQGMGYCAAVPPEQIESLLDAPVKARPSVVAARQTD